MRKVRVSKKVIPNSFTSLNMLFGFASIVQSHNNNIQYAAIFIFFAAICDTLDGMLARMTKSNSDFGVELDSLSDLVSFGVAPAFMVYMSHLKQYDILGLFVSGFFMLMGGMRLARFNVQLVGYDKNYFSGVPIPAAALTLSAYLFNYYEYNSVIKPFDSAVFPLVVFLSFMMISTIKYSTLPKFNIKSLQTNKFFFLFLLISAVAVLLTKGIAFFYVMISFILFGLIKFIYSAITPKKSISKNEV